MPRCPWWRALWHRHRRRRDRRRVWPAIRRAAARHHPDNDEDAVLEALAAWVRFIQEPGQTHWRCACSPWVLEEATRV